MDWPESSNRDVYYTAPRGGPLDPAVKPRDDEEGCGMTRRVAG